MSNLNTFVFGSLFAALYIFTLIKNHNNEPGAAIDLFFLRDRMSPLFGLVLILIVGLRAVLFLPAHQVLIHSLTFLLASQYVIYFGYVLLLQRHYLLDTQFIMGLTLCIGCLLLPNQEGVFSLMVGLLLLAISNQFKEVLYAERYQRWTEYKAKKLYIKFRHHFNKTDDSLRAIVLSIMLVEDVARPPFVRYLERQYARLHPKLVVTTGIMQVGAKGPLTDEQSVVKGIKIITKQYTASKKLTDDGNQLAYDIAVNYNGHPVYLQLIGYFYQECSKVVQNNPV